MLIQQNMSGGFVTDIHKSSWIYQAQCCSNITNSRHHLSIAKRQILDLLQMYHAVQQIQTNIIHMLNTGL